MDGSHVFETSYEVCSKIQSFSLCSKIHNQCPWWLFHFCESILSARKIVQIFMLNFHSLYQTSFMSIVCCYGTKNTMFRVKM